MRGFSLIELLVTMAIVAILAALALPGYSQVIHRSMRQDARLALLRVQQRQEIYFANHRAYADRLAGPSPPGLAIAARSDNGNYLITLRTSPDGMTYTAVATADPARRQAADHPCAGLEVNEAGRRRSTTLSGSWREDDPHRCWS